MTKKPRQPKLDRRSFVKLLPAAAGIASLGAPALAAGQAAKQAPPPERAGQQGRRPDVPQKVSKEALHAAEQVMGIEFTDAEEKMALGGVNRNLASYETLRGVNVPLDTDPAFWFHPALPGKKFDRRPAGRFVTSRQQPPSFSKVEDLAFCTVLQLAELVRTRKVTSTELTKMYLERLKRHSPKLLCVVTFTEELALQQAEQADRDIRAGKYRGPLHGIPCGVKDLFSAKGIKTTWGAEPFREQVFDYDSTVVERLRQAGAVLLAKLSTGALAMGGQWFGGMTKNPWKTDQSSSGSSAGPASGTAAGLVGFAVGTETLGSIVSPCSTCGATGLRPTYGRISRYGAMGLSWTMDKVGPICRAVEDCAVVLNALHGPDGHDITVSDVPFRWSPARPISAMRIGYQKEEFEQGSDARKAMYAEALEALRKLGARLEPIQLPKFPVQRARTLLMREMDQVMSNYDVFVSPAPGSSSLTLTNLTGHPAVVLKCGFDNELPRAIMFTSGLYDEGAALRLALAYEQATRWHTMHPKEFQV